MHYIKFKNRCHGYGNKAVHILLYTVIFFSALLASTAKADYTLNQIYPLTFSALINGNAGGSLTNVTKRFWNCYQTSNYCQDTASGFMGSTRTILNTGTLTKAEIRISPNSVASNEFSTLYFRNDTQNTTTTLFTNIQLNGGNLYSTSTLNISVNSGDLVQMVIKIPTMATTTVWATISGSLLQEVSTSIPSGNNTYITSSSSDPIYIADIGGGIFSGFLLFLLVAGFIVTIFRRNKYG